MIDSYPILENHVTFCYNNKEYRLPVVIGTEGEMAIDISKLRQHTGFITLDPGYANTGSCKSAITYMDGEKGILRYRGIPVQQLAEYSTFKETAYLLINGRLPSIKEASNFSELLNEYSIVHEDMKLFYQNFPRGSHPMGILSAMVNAVKFFYRELQDTQEETNITVTRLLSKLRTMAAMSYKFSIGHKIIYPRKDLSYCANFLNMMFDSPVMPYEIKPEVVDALRIFWILHADHEQNCSTSAVRLVGSAQVNLYAAISSGIVALWGPLHGGANQAVIEMLQRIYDNKGDFKNFINRAKDKSDPLKLMGFGHRVYKTYDPRAKIMKKVCFKLLKSLEGPTDPLLDIAQELEVAALQDDYFIERNLYPNIDFYSGIALRAMGIPVNMFTVMFAIGRLPGWIAQWKESMDDPDFKLNRPRQIYTGPEETDYIPISQRG